MFKKTFPWVVFVAPGLMLLLYYFGASSGNCAIIINGEEIGGLRGGCVTGGLLVAGLAVVVGLALVALVLAGTSMVLLGVAVFFLALLCAFSPLLAPVVGVAIIAALLMRKRKENPHQKEA